MRILLAVHHFPPRYTGGAEWRAFRTAKELLKRQHEVRVLCVERTDARAAAPLMWTDEEYLGVSVRRLAFDLASAQEPFRWSYDNPWIGQHVRELVEHYHPDVFHVISGYMISGRAVQTAVDLKIPTVVTLTDFWFLCPRITMLKTNGEISSLPVDANACARCIGEERRRYRWLGRLFPGLMRRYWRSQHAATRRIQDRLDYLLEVLKQVDAIVCPSQFLRSIFREAGVSGERLVFSRQGRDFPPDAGDRRRKSPSSGLRVSYLGQITEIKGVHVLLEAVRQLADAQLTVRVYGDPGHFPDYARRLRRLAADDPRIRMAGVYRGQDELAHIFAETDVVVVPSLWYENSPNVILEAFAHRTPVIASRLGGMAEMVQSEVNGLLFEHGNAADLARQLQRLIDDPRLLVQLETGIEPVKRIADEIDELESIYRGLMRHGPTV